jgi:hypothetical protein
MSTPTDSIPSLLVVACFSRHLDALAWAESQMQLTFGPLQLRSEDYSFHHTQYYAPLMGTGLRKRLLVFERMQAPDCLADVKRHAIVLEHSFAEMQRYPEPRPLNLDPGLLQLGKFLLGSTKDQAHRIYLRDGVFAEVTLRFHGGAFEPWPWTYADYREPAVLQFLTDARNWLHRRVHELRTHID